MTFRETARQVGLNYSWGPQGHSPLSNIESLGSGCAFLDFDGDGQLDILAVGPPGIRLFSGRPNGQFDDVSTRYGLDAYHGTWVGAAVGDVDGDGWPDLLITGFRRLLLLHNDGGRGVHDITTSAGLSPTNWGRWASSAGFSDLDRDGDLDLVLVNYLRMGQHYKQFCELAPGIRSGCPPQEYDPEYSRLYRNDRGKFRDVTIPAHCNTTHGKGLVLAFCDYDDDGLVDVYMGNDGTPGDLLHNLSNFRFEDLGIPTGAAFGVAHQPSSSMGADWGDFQGRGEWDLVFTGFSNESYTLLRPDHGQFRPISDEIGLSLPTFKPLGFGAKFLDADNDGRLDIHFTNGHVYDNVALIDPGSTYAQPMMLFHQKPDGTVEDVADRAGPEFATPLVGRGSAVGDVDNDGRLDLLVTDLEGRLRLYHNETKSAHHWLEVALVSRQPGNRLAYGARIKLRAHGAQQVRDVTTASSSFSSSDPRVHFGLGSAGRVEDLQIRWPSGRIQAVHDVAADQLLSWREGEAPRRITSR